MYADASLQDVFPAQRVLLKQQRVFTTEDPLQLVVFDLPRGGLLPLPPPDGLPVLLGAFSR